MLYEYNKLIQYAINLTHNDAIMSDFRRIADSCQEAGGKKNPKISSKKISKTLSKSTTTIKKYISKLKETGKIVRIGPPTYGGQWKILE